MCIWRLESQQEEDEVMVMDDDDGWSLDYGWMDMDMIVCMYLVCMIVCRYVYM